MIERLDIRCVRLGTRDVAAADRCALEIVGLEPVIDENIGPLPRLADRHVIQDDGRIVRTGTSDALRSEPDLLRRHVGV